MKVERMICFACKEEKKEYVGLNGLRGDPNNDWYCDNPECDGVARLHSEKTPTIKFPADWDVSWLELRAEIEELYPKYKADMERCGYTVRNPYVVVNTGHRQEVWLKCTLSEPQYCRTWDDWGVRLWFIPTQSVPAQSSQAPSASSPSSQKQHTRLNQPVTPLAVGDTHSLLDLDLSFSGIDRRTHPPRVGGPPRRSSMPTQGSWARVLREEMERVRSAAFEAAGIRRLSSTGPRGRSSGT